jgi:hypothetical protein
LLRLSDDVRYDCRLLEVQRDQHSLSKWFHQFCVNWTREENKHRYVRMIRYIPPDVMFIISRVNIVSQKAKRIDLNQNHQRQRQM